MRPKERPEHRTGIRFGIFLTNQHPPGADLVKAWEEQVELARIARDLAFDSVFAGTHYLPEGMAMPQPLPFLARLIPETGDMKIGIGVVLLALQNPVDLAESWATVDIASGGRLIFGVGLGYRDVEYEAFGIDRRERVHRFEANLDAVKRLWSEEEVDIDLPWCRVRGSGLTVRPVNGVPPIWMAANSDPAVKRAARLSDSWLINPHATVDTIERQLGLFRDAREHEGLPPVDDLPAIREIFCAPTREAAMEAVRRHLEGKYRVYARWGQDKALPENESFDIPFDELLRGRFIVGAPEDCIEQLLPWRDRLGITHFVFRTQWSGMPVDAAASSMRLLAEEVVPAIRSGSHRVAAPKGQTID